MAGTIVTQILAQTKVVILATLGATYHEVPYFYNAESNDLRGARLAYGVRPMAATFSDQGVNRFYTLDHLFEILLFDTIARGGDDSQRETALTTMYDKADSIFKALVNTKINLSTIVLNVFQPSLLEPQFFQGDKIAVLRMQYKVKYRSSLT